MIQRGLAVCALILGLTISVSAQERVVVGTMQKVNNGALFMADTEILHHRKRRRQ